MTNAATTPTLTVVNLSWLLGDYLGTQLTTLTLDSCELQDQDIQFLNQTLNIEYLALPNNKLTKLPPSQFPKVIRLDMSNNNLLGTLATIFGAPFAGLIENEILHRFPVLKH
ncbi:UNVERIFIED_CONTAM: hypothetical protein HDU68_005544, partial [Siphonaria sp. JEL0065]